MALPQSTADIDELLRAAISQKRLIRLNYQGKERIVEPHDYGIHKGSAKLLAYQVGGSSSGPLPNWRWLETASISGLSVLDQTFPGGRPVPSGKHHAWDKVFIRVQAADKPKQN